MLQFRRCRQPSTRYLPTKFVCGVVITSLLATLGATGRASADEPAADFLKRLRAAKYFDVAIMYLDRIDQYPGVDTDLKKAIALEKAQTYIDAAIASRNPKTRDGLFVQAEEHLSSFLKQGTNPRISEARLQLGKLQMVRAAQLMSGQPDNAKRGDARKSYLAAAATFDKIVNDLREKLKGMQGAKINKDKEPEKVALRDQYRGEFLQGKLNAGESRKLAARTYSDPAKEGKELLDKALADFTELSEKYDSYVQGATSMLYRGQVQQDLGLNEQARDSYLRMLEQPDADALRESKFQATSGILRLTLNDENPKLQPAIDRGQGMIDSLRPNEKRSASVQELRIQLAKAYLAKSKNTENQKPADIKRAESSGRQLLLAASKVPSEHVDEAKRLLSDLGIGDDTVVAQLPSVEDPEDLSDALAKARELLEASENIAQSLAVLKDQANPDASLQKQIVDLEKQLGETRSIATQILRRGLAMVQPDADIEILNQTRQFLAYLLYEQQEFRDAAVVGNFLARNAPGNEMGLAGGVMALNSYQLLLREIPEDQNDGLVANLEQLGEYLARTWPNDPKAAAAQGVRIRLALSKDRWEDAKALVEKMPPGSERASYERLMGMVRWNDSIRAREAGDDQAVQNALAESESFLTQGLEGIPTELVDAEAANAALTLVKVHVKRGAVDKAMKVLDHPKYGPATVIAKQGPPNAKFASELYSTELQAIVQLMTTTDGDSKKHLDRATTVMEKLRQSVAGPNAQKNLTGIYLRMARDIREQLDTADPKKKDRLIKAFRVFLERIAATTDDDATMQWVGQTLLELGEASMQNTDIKAAGAAKELLTTAVRTFEDLKKKSEKTPIAVNYQLGRGYRLLGEYKKAIDALEQVLIEKPMMLDAQIEAAQAYESWAAIVPKKFADKAYSSALNGARPNAEKKNNIWGWGKISQLTSRDPRYQEMFFEARYHVALCRYKWGIALKSDRVKQQAISDITKVNTLYPAMGGAAQRAKFEALLKTIQKDLGQPQKGLPAPAVAGA